MKFSANDLNAFIKIYESEYGEKLQRQEALLQLQKLTALIAMLVLPEPVYRTIAFTEEEGYNMNAVQKKSLHEHIECKKG